MPTPPTSPIAVAVAQSRSLAQAGRVEDAKRALIPVLPRLGKDAGLMGEAVRLLLDVKEHPLAMFWSDKLVAIAPNDTTAHALRAEAALATSNSKAAIESLNRESELLPNDPEPLRALAWILQRERRFHEASAAIDRALVLAPNDPDLYLKRAVSLLGLGRTVDAGPVYQEGLKHCPGFLDLLEGLAICSNYLESMTPEQSAEVHREYGRVLAASQPRRPAPAKRIVGPDVRLRVGLLSPDFRQHSVAFFAGSVLRHLDRRRVELFCYHPYSSEDAVTARFKALVGADHWRHLQPGNFDRIELAIRSDRLDVLVELSGLTRDHALQAVARKPAPAIATYIGYPNTTGVPAVDYRIVDSWTDPAPRADALCTEKLVRLDPCFLCFDPPPPGSPDLPDVTWTPPVRGRQAAPGTRPPTFGSLNNLSKINDRVLRVWARLLERVSDAVLVFKTFGLGDASVRADLLARCTACGLPLDRVEIVPPPPGQREHMDAYNRIDVGLDPYPYNGTTTTCEGFMMGLPVVAIEGPSHVSRVSVSLLQNLGLADLIASDEEQYIGKAAALINDQDRLRDLRTSIRARFLASPICDSGAYARRLEAALRAMAAAEAPRAS